MRLEKNAYEDDLPISISIQNIVKYPPHYHNDMEILFVLKGEIKFRNGPFNYLLKPGDIFTNNRCEVHSMYSTGRDNAVALIKISSRFFTRFFPKFMKSTYMFYSDKEYVPQQEHLKHMILSLIDKYLIQGYNYKQQCIDGTFKIIQYLNENFNVFGFAEKHLTKFESTNPVTVKRFQNIIHYTYENHSYNITLNDLAEMEHLNTFYLSHLIKDNIGISYVQFLYFVRVEWSEVNLLNPNKKISAIAREVGFSSTEYYRKYFKQWFGCTPEEYRKEFVPITKSENTPEISQPLDHSDAIKIVKTILLSTDSFDINQSLVEKNRISITISQLTPSIKYVDHHIRILITLEDYHVIQTSIFKYLHEQRCNEVIILYNCKDSPIEVKSVRDYLSNNGLHVTLCMHYDYEPKTFGFDSIASMFYILNRHMLSNEYQITVPLRDQGDLTQHLKGQMALMTSSGIPKPSYYAFQLLGEMNGELLACGKYYCIVKLCGRGPTYMVLTYNYGEAIEKLCQTQSTEYEVKSAIDDFKDELEIIIKLQLPKGKYFVVKYTMDYYNNVFNFMAKMNFPHNMKITENISMRFCTTPQTDVFTTEVEDSMELNSFFIGVGIQLVIVQKL